MVARLRSLLVVAVPLLACGRAEPQPGVVPLPITVTTQEQVVFCGTPCLESPCGFLLVATPSDVSLLEVLFNGVSVPSTSDGGTNWVYFPPPATTTAPLVRFEGGYCATLIASDAAHPVHLEFRIVQVL